MFISAFKSRWNKAFNLQCNTQNTCSYLASLQDQWLPPIENLVFNNFRILHITSWYGEGFLDACISSTIKLLKYNLKCLWNEIFTSFFIDFLKSTTGMISFSSYRTFYILSCDVTSMTRDNGNNKKVWYLGDYLIKFNETWYTWCTHMNILGRSCGCHGNTLVPSLFSSFSQISSCRPLAEDVCML